MVIYVSNPSECDRSTRIFRNPMVKRQKTKVEESQGLIGASVALSPMTPLSARDLRNNLRRFV